MAIADPVLVGGAANQLASTANLTTYPWDPGDLVAGRLYVLFVFGVDNATAGDNDPPIRVDGKGQTWGFRGNTVIDNTQGLWSVYSCEAVAPTSDGFEFEFAAAMTGCGAALIEIASGFVSGNNGADALGTFTQFPTSGGGSTSNPVSVDVPALADADESVILGGVSYNVENTTTWGTATELWDDTFSLPSRTLSVAWRRGGGTTLSATQGAPGGAAKRIFAIEVKPAAPPEEEPLAATRVLDSFDRANADVLGTTERVGASSPPAWTSVVTSGTVVLGIREAKAAYVSSSGTNISTYGWVPGHLDQIVVADVTLADTDGRANAGLMFRGVDDTTYLFIKLERGTSNWPTGGIIFNVFGGTDGAGSHNRTDVAYALTAGQTYRLMVVISGDLLRVYVDGSLELEHTLSANDVADFDGIRTGIRWRVDSSPTNGEDGSSRFDDFEVLELDVVDGLRVAISRTGIVLVQPGRDGTGTRTASSWAGQVLAVAQRQAQALRQGLSWANAAAATAQRTASAIREGSSWAELVAASAERAVSVTRQAIAHAQSVVATAARTGTGLRPALSWALQALVEASRSVSVLRSAVAWSESAITAAERVGTGVRETVAFAQQAVAGASVAALRVVTAWAQAVLASAGRSGSGTRPIRSWTQQATSRSERMGGGSRTARAWSRIVAVIAQVFGGARVDRDFAVGLPRVGWNVQIESRWALGPPRLRWRMELVP